MPVLKSRTALELARGIKAFLRIEGGFTREAVPDPELTVRVQARRLREAETRIAQQRRALKERERRITRLNVELARKAAGPETSGIHPKNIIWMFGTARTGSTWLGRMMGDVRSQTLWMEPSVGRLFGGFYYLGTWEKQRTAKNFILGDPARKTWVRSIRDFVLDGAGARFPELTAEEFLIVKEPYGSIGAPLMMEALPESRMILLVRDPRDVVASVLDGAKEGGWLHEWWDQSDRKWESHAVRNPNDYVAARADFYLQDIGNSKEAYDAHNGYKALVRYEDLQVDTLDVMLRMYSDLGVSVDRDELARIVEKHSWKNVPQDQKGRGKFYRKATPGSWREDLTPEQAKMVEEITAPVLEEFYPG
jgi:hypothetical protein